MHRRNVGVTQACIDRQFLGEAPVILDESCSRSPGHFHIRIAGKQSPKRRISGEEVFKGAGSSATVGGPSQSYAAEEKDSAPLVMGVGIGLDVRELTAKLQGVLAQQIGDAVLQIPVWVG